MEKRKAYIKNKFDYMDVVFAIDAFDEAIIGYYTHPLRVVYSYRFCIDIFKIIRQIDSSDVAASIFRENYDFESDKNAPMFVDFDAVKFDPQFYNLMDSW